MVAYTHTLVSVCHTVMTHYVQHPGEDAVLLSVILGCIIAPQVACQRCTMHCCAQLLCVQPRSGSLVRPRSRSFRCPDLDHCAAHL
jgi:hypothetical protein